MFFPANGKRASTARASLFNVPLGENIFILMSYQNLISGACCFYLFELTKLYPAALKTQKMSTLILENIHKRTTQFDV